MQERHHLIQDLYFDLVDDAWNPYERYYVIIYLWLMDGNLSEEA